MRLLLVVALCACGRGLAGQREPQYRNPRVDSSEVVREWRFRPFVLDTQAAPVCPMVRMVYPSDKAPPVETLPLPLPDMADALTNVPRQMLKRTAGKIMVVPDDEEKVMLHKARIPRLIAAFHFCIDERGKVTRVVPIRSSGLPGYDRKIRDTISRWTYQPFLDEGRPVGVCSSVHFVYSQAGVPNGGPTMR